MNAEDVVISSRIRLARNLNDLPFPNRMTAAQHDTLVQRINDAINPNGDFMLLRMKELASLQRRMLVERHLISPDLAKKDQGAALISKDETISIMIGEEDHLRIQSILPGLNLNKADELTQALDRILASKLPYAYDENLGYLTACPTNLGTGMRASVMLHVPAVSLAGQANALFKAVNKLGYAVRGLYGEGSSAPGHIYQISNQMTLGILEEDIISNLQNTLQQIVDREHTVQDAFAKSNSLDVQDLVFRSYGILQHARKISTAECMEHLSHLKLGIALQLFPELTQDIINHLLVDIQSASLQQRAGHELSDKERDAMRAKIVRTKLKEYGKE